MNVAVAEPGHCGCGGHLPDLALRGAMLVHGEERRRPFMFLLFFLLFLLLFLFCLGLSGLLFFSGEVMMGRDVVLDSFGLLFLVPFAGDSSWVSMGVAVDGGRGGMGGGWFGVLFGGLLAFLLGVAGGGVG